MALSTRNKSLLVYIAKCVCGILLSTFLARLLNRWIDFPWSLISVLLVLSPEGKDAVDLALTRIKANLVGAISGVLVLLTTLSPPWNMALGAAIALFACDRLHLNTGARSTLAAMIIILLLHEGTTPWTVAMNRVLSVAAGCALALVITYVFHAVVKIDGPAVNSEKPNES